ncbi:hypothetical protein AGLY_014764 [Aphis glycines]|uniref:Uncharacterized protein n=1 Tax=Aphis glycines TaxID=307491 RepID=A0A6G0T3E2_APHGL|nr:hypothetical protein AGLY_014764 [Aphis glycines]
MTMDENPVGKRPLRRPRLRWEGVFFDDRVEHIKFVDFCGKYRIPLLQYLCSSKCVVNHRNILGDSTDSNMMRKTCNNAMQNVSLSPYLFKQILKPFSFDRTSYDFFILINSLNSSEHILALAFIANFISLISLSISSINRMMKSISLFLYICSTCMLVIRNVMSYPAIGFLLRMKKFSARFIMNRVNLSHNNRSISSHCLIAMLTRIEFIELSIKTRSRSLRLINIGVNINSLFVCISISGLL